MRDTRKIPGRLAGKRVLVTGTGGGQGAAAQELFCAHGATVIGCDARAGSAEAQAEMLRDRGLCAFGATVDLSDPGAARAWVEQGVAQLGGLDVLYNNAGAPRLAPFAEMTLEQWRFTIANELDIVFHVTAPAWSHLCRGGGSVINVGSVVADTGVGRLGHAAHCAAKGGVVALTRQLAAEGAAHDVRVNTISPGFVETPGTHAVPPEVKEWVVGSLHMLHRAGTPADVVQLALYLASDESSFVTGVNVPVDGGWTAGSA
jgi:meso-butanediol dehydrogenase / (S,S)-butanediol dehydrogenase / diacetyl reductase